MLSSIHDRKTITTRFFSGYFTFALLCVLGIPTSIGQSYAPRGATSFASKLAFYGCYSAFMDMVPCSRRCTLES